jgi:hypothetical protein
MTRTATLAGLAVLIVLAVGGAAGAAPAYACTIDDPSDCPTYTVPHHNTLTVSTTRGTITSSPSGISCPSDCGEDYEYDDFCTDLPGKDECEPGEPVDVTLTASGGGLGFGPHWTGCDSASGSTCDILMEGNQSVSVTWTDDADPTVGLSSSSPSSKAGPSTVFTASANDNAGVAKVDFYVDDVLKLSDTSAPYQFAPDLSALGDGTTHTVKAISQDTSGRRSSAASASFTVDKSTGPTGVSTPPAYTKTTPQITFSAGDASVVCRTKFGGTVVGTTSSCTSPYTPQGVTTDGQYTVEIQGTDDVGNTATVTKTFTRDTGAPNLTVTKPENGDAIGGPFAPTLSADDGFSTPTVDCKIDGGAFGSCSGLEPADGAHTLTVRASDAAGNTTEVTRSFTYDSHVPVVTITGGPGEGSVVYSHSTAFTFTTSDITPVTTSCKLDGGAFGACTSAGSESLSGLGLGIHTFTLRVVDSAGNTSTVVRRFTVADKPADGGGGGTGGTGGTGGSTGGTGGSTGGTGTGGSDVRNATVTTFWQLFGKRTRIGTLTLEGAPKGAKVTVTCKGKGCAFKKKTLTSTGGKIKLAKRFKKRKLAAKTVITITVSDATGTKRFRYTLRAGKFPKKSIK